MSYQSAKNAINTDIVTNHEERITGVVLNSVLLEMLEYVRSVVGNENDLTSFNNLIQAVEDLQANTATADLDLNDVVLNGNVTSRRLSANSFFAHKEETDFAQMGDLLEFSSGLQFLGEYNSVAEIEGLQGDDGDFAILKWGIEKYLFQFSSGAWGAVNGLFVSGLKVNKRPSNLDNSILQKNDFATGWVNENLFVNGIWKGDDNPSAVDLANYENWSNSLEL